MMSNPRYDLAGTNPSQTTITIIEDPLTATSGAALAQIKSYTITPSQLLRGRAQIRAVSVNVSANTSTANIPVQFRLDGILIRSYNMDGTTPEGASCYMEIDNPNVVHTVEVWGGDAGGTTTINHCTITAIVEASF